MKKQLSLPVTVILCGVLGLCAMGLRMVLRSAVGEDGLLPRMDIREAVLICLTAAALVLAGMQASVSGLPAGRIAGIACLLPACGILYMLINGVDTGMVTLMRVYRPIACAAAAVFAVMAWFRLRGKAVPFACYAIPCVFFALQIVICYPIWSEKTRVQDYFFPVAALVSLMLYCYHRAAEATGLKPRRRTLVLALAALFACPAAIPGGIWPVLWISSALWILGEILGITKAEV